MSGSNSSAPGTALGAPPEAVSDSPVGLTVHSLTPPSLDPVQRTRVGRWKMIAVLAVCAAPVLASYFTYFVVKPQGRTNYSELIVPPVDLPATLPITTLEGAAVPLQSLRGQWLLVSVAAAACDARCEKNLVLVRQLRETLGREKDRVDKVWLVTDGGRPIEPLLAATGMVAMKVPREQLARWLVPAAGQALEDHVYVVDPMGMWMMRVPVDPDPPKLKRDIERLLRASSSWDQAGR
jgi:hypothetical protein